MKSEPVAGLVPGAAVATHVRWAWMRLKRGRLVWVALVLLALPVLATALLAASGKWGRDLFDNILEVHFRFLVLFLPALATSQAVGEEIDQKTFTFVFARPAPRWAMSIGKYLAATFPLALAFALSIALSFAIALLTPPAGPAELVENLPFLLRSLMAAWLGVFVFAAIALLIGTWMTSHPFAAVMGYLLVVEGLVGSLLPLAVSLGAMSWHVRNVAGLGTATQASLVGFLGQAQLSPWISLGVLVLVGSLALAGAAISIESAEYRTDR